MKGVILAGGKGTRLYPLTKATNKHLLPVGKEPMIYHWLHQMTLANINDIMIITSTDHMGDVVRCLGSGSQFNCLLTYRVQETARGIADALYLARDFAGDKKICVALADNIFEYSISPYVENFSKQISGGRIILKEVGDPERYGVAALDENQVIAIQEKPQNPSSSYAVVGLYFYDSSVFNHIETLKPSLRGELEITAVNNIYISKGQLEYDIYCGRWTDAGTLDSLKEANEILYDNNNKILVMSKGEAANA